MDEHIWFHLATTRGDIVAQVPGVTCVEDLDSIIASRGIIKVSRPMSPKTEPVLQKICEACVDAVDLTEAETRIASTKRPTCDRCKYH